MPKTYAMEVKEKFLGAAKAARKGGKDWNGTLQAAKEAGYEGGLSGLRQMFYAKGKRRKAAATVAQAAPQPVRRNRATGEITARQRGRPGRDWENGFLTAAGQFVPAKQPKRAKRAKRRMVAAPAQPVAAPKAPVSGLDQIDAIIAAEVEKRMKMAKAAAIEALTAALGF